jgi:hypothetical protein
MNMASIISRVSTLLLVLSIAFSFWARPSAAQSSALLWVVPIEEGGRSTDNPKLAIRLDDASLVYGAEVHLSFEPTILAVVDADQQLPGVQISSGFCPKPGFVVRNRVENQEGTIEYILTQLNPQAPCNEGRVAMIEFQCKAAGESAVNITSSVVVGLGTEVIAHTTQDGIVNCQAAMGLYQLYLPILWGGFTVQAYLPLIMHNQRVLPWYPAREKMPQFTTEQKQPFLRRIIHIFESWRIVENWRQ